MDDLQVLETRYSRRNYLEIPIEPEKLIVIKDMIKKQNEEFGLDIELIQEAGDVFNSFRKSYGMFKNVTYIIVLKGNSEDINLKEKAGYCGERLVIEATKLGLGTCFVGGTYDRSSSVLNIKESQDLVCVITIGNVPSGRTRMENIAFSMLHKRTKSIDELIKSDMPLPDWVKEGIAAVQLAPSAINSQKVRFEYKDYVLTAYVPNDKYLNMVDLGIAKLHFEIATGGKFALGNHSNFTKE